MHCTIHTRGYWLGSEDLPHKRDEAVVDTLADILAGKTVVDLGCGDGFYVRALGDRLNIHGFDGNPNTQEVAGDLCGVADLTEESFDVGQYDAVLCVEVGEHIPDEYEATVIRNIVKTARDMIVITWAQPGMSGHGHVNCQYTDTIRRKFQEYGFACDDAATALLRFSGQTPWFKLNSLVLRKE